MEASAVMYALRTAGPGVARRMPWFRINNNCAGYRGGMLADMAWLERDKEWPLQVSNEMMMVVMWKSYHDWSEWYGCLETRELDRKVALLLCAGAWFSSTHCPDVISVNIKNLGPSNKCFLHGVVYISVRKLSLNTRFNVCRKVATVN